MHWSKQFVAVTNRKRNRFLKKNAEFANQYDETGATPLHYLRYAIQQGDTKWVSRFLQRFPGLRDSMDKNGKPFRAIAIESGNKEVIQLFQ